MSFTRTTLAAVIALLLPVAAAQATTSTVGKTAPAGASILAYPKGYLVATSGTPGFTVPGPGLLTGFSMRGRADGGPLVVRAAVLRPTGGEGKFKVAYITDPQTLLDNGQVQTFALSTAVQAGDVITTVGNGTEAGNQPAAAYNSGDNADGLAYITGDPALDADVDVASADSTVTAYRPNLAATVESDADGDGFGDDTQDSCPADAKRHAGTCTSDGSLSAAQQKTKLTLGDVSQVGIDVSNPSTGLLENPTVTLTASPGLSFTTVTTTIGSCATTPQTSTCTLTGLGAPGAAHITAQFKAATAGTQTVSATLSSSTPDPQTANNTATATFTVAKPCIVPTLKGLRLNAASKKLAKAGCLLGTIARPKVHIGQRRRAFYVTSQRIKARTVVAAGTKVGLTLRPKPLPKKKHVKRGRPAASSQRDEPTMRWG